SGVNVDGGTVRIASGGSLSIGSGASNNLRVGLNTSTTGSSGTTTGTLDASAAASLTVNVANVQVGVAGSGRPGVGTLLLPSSSTITATSSFVVGTSGNAFNAGTSSVTTAAGAGTTTLRTPSMTVGGNKSVGALTLGAGSTWDVAGIGGGRAALTIGSTSAGGGSGAWSGNLDASAGTFIASLSSLTIGNRSVTSSTANVAATLTLGNSTSNHLDILGASTATTGVVNIGRSFGGTTGGSATGILTIGNLDSSSQIVDTNNGTAILLGTAAGGIPASGTLNLNGGTLTIATSGLAITGGGSTSVVNFNGGTLKAGASSANWISNLSTANIAGGARFHTNGFNINIPQPLSGTGGLTKLGTGILTLSGASGYTGPTSVDAGELNLTGSVASNITVNNGAVLNGEGSTSASLNFSGASKLFFDPSTGGSFNANTVNGAGGTVEVLASNGTNGTGILVLNAPGGITGVPNTNFVFNTRGSIYLGGGGTQLLVDKLPGALLTWKGNQPNPTFWDIRTTSNWDNGGSPDQFYNADDVLLDDTATSFTVAVQPTSLAPNSVTFNNSSNAYTVQGGAIAGAASVTKNGSNVVIIANDNTYTGG
ncbi:MAG TPA: autotransporter-associated beta strand repeat-containing protein, partial [Glaciihabitans sp.]|nr:autotransporter-associated beta strand repeat-containing protein [Glaciihabitans sp.]